MSDGLNPAQRGAVRTLSGPLLVLAGAGTGKTRVVTYRIAELIRHGTAPSQILAVTFTNKAAAEMQERATALLGRGRSQEKPQISTFHSLCVRILRRHITHLGFPAQFAICDRGDQESLARGALREIKVPNEALRPGDLLYFVSRWKMASVRPAEAASLAQSDKEHLAAMAYRRYQKALKAAGSVDFDDLLLCTEELFDRFPAVRCEESHRFRHLLVDEYQDTNGTQYKIVKALAEPHRNLCVVGDDDQSIYGWRGAEVAHILRFKKDWPEAKVVRLEENYRSTAEILQLANRLIAYNKNRHDKVLRAARPGGEKPRILQFQDEAAESKQIVEEIKARLAQPGVQPRDLAILFRTNEQPRPFETELRRAKIPYVLIGGMSFYDRKEVRDILAYLKLLVSPHDDVSLLRVINTPARGIGQSTVTQLLEHAVQQGKPTWDTLRIAARQFNLTAAAAKGIEAFCGLIVRYQERMKSEPLVDIASALVSEIKYQDEINRLYKEPEEQQNRWAAVGEVISAIGGYVKRASKPTMKGFLDDVALGGRDDDSDKESQLARNAVALMTLHSAKGLEFSQVYLVGMEEGLLPHHRAVSEEGAAIDEERRLCYVGITRAQDRLTMSLALSRMKWGKARPTQPSRFLFEIIGQADNPAAMAAKAAGKIPARSPHKKAKPTTAAKARPQARAAKQASAAHRRSQAS